MLQRQIMFKQLQELQRRQQIQELGDSTNQTYINQHSSLKQAPGVQFSSGMPVNEPSQMYMLGNMQMLQHGGSSAVQGLPNGLHFQPSSDQSHFDMPLYGTPTSNIDKKLNQYSHPQGPFNVAGNLFMSQQGNNMPNRSLQPSQAFQEKNSSGQVPVQTENFSGSYSEQGVQAYRNFSLLESEGKLDDASWHGVSPGKTTELALFQSTATLDPLEEKILFNTDGNGWESSFSQSNKMDDRGFEGSWSALMQSAVAETSSGDNGIHDEWSGLSLRKPEPLENQILDNERQGPQNDWVDRKLQNLSSPKLKPDNVFHNSNASSIFSGFLQSDHQQNEKFHSEKLPSVPTPHSPISMTQLGDYNSQQKRQIGKKQLFQTSWSGNHMELSNNDVHHHNIFPCSNDNQPRDYFTGQKSRGTGLHESTSHNVAGDIQNPFNQANHLNIHGYSAESHKMTPENNAESMSTIFGASSNFNGQNVTAQSENMLELLNKDESPNDHAPGVQLNSKVSAPRELTQTENSLMSLAKPSNVPLSQGFSFTLGPSDLQTSQSYSFFSSLSMGNSSAPSHTNHNANAYMKNQGPAPSLQGHMASSGPKFPFLDNVSVTQPSFSGGLSTLSSDTKAPQDISSSRPNKFPNLFRQPYPNELPNQNSLSQNYSQVHYPRNPETEYGNRSPLQYDGVNSQMANANTADLFLSGQKSEVSDKVKVDVDPSPKLAFSPGNSQGWNFSQESSSMGYLQNAQTKEMFGQNDTQNFSIDSIQASNVTYQPQTSVQMAPSWFKNYGNSKDVQMLPNYNHVATINGAQPLSGIAQGLLQENKSIVQVNLTNAFQGSITIESKPVASDGMVPSGFNYQNLVPSMPKKRKMVTFDMVPWYKEVHYDPSRLEIISIGALQWEHASHRRHEEVQNEALIVDDIVLPVVRAKRRLVFTTKLMQQVFRPPPPVMLRENDSLNCYYVAFSAARLALGDACSLTCDTNEVPSDKLETLKNTNAGDFSKVTELLVSRVKKLEGDLSRVEKSLSIVDSKMEMQELEKFSMINCFAKYHMKAHPSTVDPASTSGPTTLLKATPQRYVIALQMPRRIPEVTDCLSL